MLVFLKKTPILVILESLSDFSFNDRLSKTVIFLVSALFTIVRNLNIVKDFPFTGTGWGTFGNIFPTYKSNFNKNFMYHAHNDYIEILANGGIFSLIFSGWFLVAVIQKVFKSLARRKSSFSIYLTWGDL